MTKKADFDGNRLEQSFFFLSLARFLIRFRYFVITLCFLATGFFGYMAVKHITIDTSMEAFFDPNSKAKIALDEFRAVFGRDDVFMILVKGDVFSMEYLKRLNEMHNELAELDIEAKSVEKREEEYGDNELEFAGEGFEEFGEDEGWGEEQGGSLVDEITSIINIRRTKGTEDGIEVAKLFDPMPTSQEEIDIKKQEVLADPTVVGQVVDSKGTYSVILIRTFQMDIQDSIAVVDDLREKVAKYKSDDFDVWVSGMPALSYSLNVLLLRDLSRMTGMAVIIMLIIMSYLYRTWTAVFGPILVVAQGAIWTVGMMAVLGLPLTMMTNIVPAFLFCVGLGDSVHLISTYRDFLKTNDNRVEALSKALASCGIPIVFTSITTMVGLLSFKTASIEAIGDMGLASAIGVFVALLYSVVFLTPFLSLENKSFYGFKHGKENDAIDRFLKFCNGASLKMKNRRVTIVTCILLIFLAFGLAGLIRVWHNPLSWLPKSDETKISFDLMDEHIGGTANVQLLIETSAENGVKNLELMKALEFLDQHISKFKHPDMDVELVGNSLSLLDIVKESNRALNQDNESFYKLPATDRGISDLLFMFENAGQSHLRRMATSDFQKTQITIRIKWMDAGSYRPFTEYLDAGIKEYIGEKAVVKATGVVYNLLTTISVLIGDLLKSFSVALVVITLVMIFIFKDLKLGLIAMIPNLVPIIFIAGFMGGADVPIDLGNILIGSISIGLAVDDTIHFLHHYKKNYNQFGDVDRAISYSLNHAGRALISTSVILCLGFSVYTISEMLNIQRFGLLVGLTILFAVLVDLVVTPAVIRVFYLKKENLEKSKTN